MRHPIILTQGRGTILTHERLEGVLFVEFESELKIVGRYVTSGAVCQALAVKMVEGAPAREHGDGWSRDGLLVDDEGENIAKWSMWTNGDGRDRRVSETLPSHWGG